MSADKYPTMIIPEGTEIRINSEGQLSIRTKGNLVLQNSGTFLELESTHGSIRIEEKVSVEAVTLRAFDGCFIEGTLTAWTVAARRIVLEGRAKACIMLPETQQLEVGKSSRLTGNFGSDKEIRDLLNRFQSRLPDTSSPSSEPAPFVLRNKR